MFSIWGGNVISWSREHGHPASIHSRGFWGHAPPGNFGNFRCSEVHSGAFWGIQKSIQSFLRRVSSSWSSLLAELLEHRKPSPSARVYAYTTVLYACTSQCMHAEHMHGKLIGRVIVCIVRIWKLLHSHHYQGRRQLFRGWGSLGSTIEFVARNASRIHIFRHLTLLITWKLFIPLLFF